MKYSSNGWVLFLFVGTGTGLERLVKTGITPQPPSVSALVSGILNPYLPEILPYAYLRSVEAMIPATVLRIRGGYTLLRVSAVVLTLASSLLISR